MTEPQPDAVMTVPKVSCPVEDCDFDVKMHFPPLQRSPYIQDESVDQAYHEAVVRQATEEGERVAQILNEHAGRAHDVNEFEAACEAVAAGLR